MTMEAFWWLTVLVAFLLLLIVPAAIVESRWGREWIRRLRGIEHGRARQRAEYLAANTFYPHGDTSHGR